MLVMLLVPWLPVPSWHALNSWLMQQQSSRGMSAGPPPPLAVAGFSVQARMTASINISTCPPGCRDPQLTVVGFSWDGADEGKAQLTFGRGRGQLFSRFLDLQQVAAGLGYHGCGLGALTRQVGGGMGARGATWKGGWVGWEARRVPNPAGSCWEGGAGLGQGTLGLTCRG